MTMTRSRTSWRKSWRQTRVSAGGNRRSRRPFRCAYTPTSSSGQLLTYIKTPTFIDQTLLLLSDVAVARSTLVPAISRAEPQTKSPASPLDYPFNLILTSATIPAALAAHLDSTRAILTQRGSSPYDYTASQAQHTLHSSWRHTHRGTATPRYSRSSRPSGATTH